MKKINIIKYNLLFILVIAAIFTACTNNNDEYEAPNSFSDVGWYVAYPEANLPETLLTNKDDYITFSDLSQNATAHNWIIEQGNFYLETPIQRNDSISSDKVIGSGTSTAKTVAVWFRNSGLNEVTLRNTFSEKVTLRGPDGLRVEADSIGPDEWLYEKTFVVDVYDTIVPIIRVQQKGVVLDHTSNDTIYVEAGDSLEFFNETTQGRPNDWTWNVAGSTSLEENPSIVLKKLGVFTNNNVLMRRTGNGIPTDSDRYQIPAPIRVIPSSQPFQLLGAITELENQLIQIPFNGEFAPFVNQEQYFTVTLNGVESTNFTISINDTDATILDLMFNEPIYRDDDIVISYDGSGTLESTDTRSPEPFSETVSMFQHEVVVYDFEDVSTHPNWIAHNSNIATTIVEISTDVAASGNYSMKIDASAGSGFWSAFQNFVEQYSLTAGTTYQLEYKIYKLPGAAINMNGPWITRDGGGTVFQFWNNVVRNAADETWTTVSPGGRHTATGGDDYEFYLRHNGQGVLYIDDIRILEVDQR
ncbi:hypothetical protein MHTCC0001_03300 [Flavobacteriaceae bacterium MHTCC 0001]